MKKAMLLALVPFCLCGCALMFTEPYSTVSYYDLSYPAGQEDAGGVSVSVADVKAVKLYSEKMVFRVSENRLEMDEYNRWADSPARMIRNYMDMAFQGGGREGGRRFAISAELVRLEADVRNSTVCLVLKVSVAEQPSGNCILEKTYSQSVAAEKITGESFAKGVEKALSAVCREISKDIVEKAK